jgi:phosphoadenosine phosphosulfate reductase
MIDSVQREFEGSAPHAVLTWAIGRFRPRIVLACSFGGPGGMVLLDMIMAIDRSIPVFYLDTGLLFPQTHALIERASKRYGIAPIAVQPELSVAEQAERHGETLWLRAPDACCSMRKVESQRRFLRSYDAWISAIRRDQTPMRKDTPVVHFDTNFGITKINPLALWDERMVWTYVGAHNLDYNELHDANYPSIGCIPCTRAIDPGESPRSGRWPHAAKTECGLHVRLESASR